MSPRSQARASSANDSLLVNVALRMDENDLSAMGLRSTDAIRILLEKRCARYAKRKVTPSETADDLALAGLALKLVALAKQRGKEQALNGRTPPGYKTAPNARHVEWAEPSAALRRLITLLPGTHIDRIAKPVLPSLIRRRFGDETYDAIAPHVKWNREPDFHVIRETSKWPGFDGLEDLKEYLKTGAR